MPIGRVFEYTEAYVVDQFRQGKSIFIEQLTRLPCLFMQEGVEDEIAYVGQINRATITGEDVYFDYVLDADVPPLRNSMIYANRMSLGMHHEFEFSRNHWAVKDVDIYKFLLRSVRPRRQRPTVFQLAEHEHIDHNLASAMMPFDAEFDQVYEAIRLASSDAGLRCRRADDIWEHVSIIQDVVSLLDHSRVVICDCTGTNPNVFYEVGIAHIIGRDVVIIAQGESDVPFDLRFLRYIKYQNNEEGRVRLRYDLQARIQTILGH